MTDTASVPEGTRVFYRDIKPYDMPERLEDLRGPSGGQLTLPVNVYWGPWSVVDLDIHSDVVKAYQATLREGRVGDQVILLNRDLLVRIWPELMLPARVRQLWESRFPQLSVAA